MPRTRRSAPAAVTIDAEHTPRRPRGRYETRAAADGGRQEHVQALERGLALLTVFNARTPSMTLSQAAEKTGVTRAVARRYLLTLETLGYVSHEGSYFALTPRVLDLGFTYLASINVADVAKPFMLRVVDTLRESCSVGVLDRHDVVYVARVPADRIMTTNLVVGSRLPAHATAMGKVLLAYLPADRLAQYFATAPLSPLTGRTIGDEGRLRRVLAEVKRLGWAANDEESEKGVRTIAAPLFNRNQDAVAAINVAGHASRVSIRELRGAHLPVLLEAARDISRALGARALDRDKGSSG
jgi:IclR family pca regulon transcriptional regulator